MSPHYQAQPGLALPAMNCHAMIEYVLQNHEAPTTIVICSNREAFLEDLELSLRADNVNGNNAEHGRLDSLHPLLIPTIHQLASSSTIKLAFVPSLTHLRAYLACYSPAESLTPMSTSHPRMDTQVPMLAIYGLLTHHRDTTEHSVQGLSRTLSNAAEAANAWGMRLTLVEPPRDAQPPSAEPAMESETNLPLSPWSEQVSLLNTTFASTNGTTWAGRMVSIGAIVAKWCRIAGVQDFT